MFESQEDAVAGILADQIVAGDVVVIRYEGPKGGPACRRCSTRPAISSPRAWAVPRCSRTVASRAAPPASSIGHASPEAACGGAIGLVEGDRIEIDIPNRRIHLAVTDDVLAARRAAQDARGWKPVSRERVVSAALQAYAALTTSADTGAVRDVTQVQR